LKEDHAMTEQKTGFDFEALRRGIEQSDADLLVSLYADDVEVQTVNKNTTPSSPDVQRGREAIGEVLRDVCDRDMTHRVKNEVVGDDRIAFNEVCEYPDGIRVLAATTLEIRDGRISRQVTIEAWDE
jgi:hypothetical protein